MNVYTGKFNNSLMYKIDWIPADFLPCITNHFPTHYMNDLIEKHQELKKLEEACSGLLPGSDMTNYFQPFYYDATLNGSPNLENVLNWAGHKSSDTPVEMITLGHYLEPVTAQLPEYGVAEKAIAWRYLKLQHLLEEMLDSIRVFKIGSRGSEAIIIGDTPSGNCAGLKISKEYRLFA